MNQAWVSPISVASPRLCLHCGAILPALEISSFCCQGCATVYALLKERSIPSNPVIEGFSYLDDEEFLKDYAFGDPLQMHFYLEGVHCAACVWLTEKLPEFVPGVESLTLNLASGVALVRLHKGGSFVKAAQEISRLGYRPHPIKQGESDDLRRKENRRHLIQLGIAGMVSGNIMLLAVALYAGADGSLAKTFRWASFILYLPVLLYSATPFYKSSIASLRKRQISIDVPIIFGLLVGTAASFVNLVIGSEHIYFDSLSALVFLLLSTRYLLRKVNQHALSATELIHHLAPSKARLKDVATRQFREVKVEELKKGEIVQVLPGECFPIDGVVVEGRSSVNCALLTGESTLLSVSPGSNVNAGTWNQDAPLEIRIFASGAATRLGKILASMEYNLANKAPIVTYLDRIGQGFVIAVLFLTCFGFFLGLAVDWHEAINRALAVAIVVCPCTFALATPLAMSLAISRCARNGVLVKSADVLERLSHVQEVFFDKTGTLTFGELRVIEWKEFEPGATEALRALESRSAHPISKAVQRFFNDQLGRDILLPEVEDFQERLGLGLSGKIYGSHYEVRSLIDLTAESTSSPGINTRVAVHRENILVGTLTLSDRIRPDSKSAIDRLRSLNLGIHLLSGDTHSTVRNVASQIGIEQSMALASVSPEKKAAIVKSLPMSLMVGDGANDAIALASAHTSIAVQGGMEMSIKAAGAYSSQPGVMSVYSLIVVARETMRVIRRNLVFAVLYNIVGIAVALTGHLDPLFAAILMPASALTVFISTMMGTHPLRTAFVDTSKKASE